MTPLLGFVRGASDPDLVETPQGVTIHVDISPRACIEAVCGGELPTTGAGIPEILIWIGIGLIAAGVLVVGSRLIRRRRHR